MCYVDLTLFWYFDVICSFASRIFCTYSHLPNVLCYLVTKKRNNENCWHNTFCTLFFLLASSFQNVLCHLTLFSFNILCIVFKRCSTGGTGHLPSNSASRLLQPSVLPGLWTRALIVRTRPLSAVPDNVVYDPCGQLHQDRASFTVTHDCRHRRVKISNQSGTDWDHDMTFLPYIFRMFAWQDIKSLIVNMLYVGVY